MLSDVRDLRCASLGADRRPLLRLIAETRSSSRQLHLPIVSRSVVNVNCISFTVYLSLCNSLFYFRTSLQVIHRAWQTVTKTRVHN